MKPILTSIVKNELQRITLKISERFMADNYPNLDDVMKNGMTGIRFDWGSELEITNRLDQYTTHPEMMLEKFPLIVMLTDVPITITKLGEWDAATVELLILKATEQSYTSPQREIYSFVPVLQPIYGYLFEELQNSNVFAMFDVNADLKGMQVTERYKWGLNGINKFNDFMDAIHIRNLDLKLNNTNC